MTERLPEPYKPLLLAYLHNFSHPLVGEGWYDPTNNEGEHWQLVETDSYNMPTFADPSHWMLLPAHPLADKQEEG